MSEIPPREAICIDCRTALAHGEDCDAPRHRVASLRDPGARRSLRDAIWGPPSRRRQLKRAAASGSLGGGSAGAADCGGCADVGGISGEAVLIIVAVIAAILVIWLLYKLVRAIAAYRNRAVAAGAERGPARLGQVTAAGVVEGDTVQSPLTLDECVAYGVELSEQRWWKRHVMLRDGATAGFRLRLDDGRELVVPAGRAVVALGDVPADGDLLGPAQAYAAREFANSVVETDPLLPFNRVRMRLVKPGDRVELHTPLRDEIDPTAPAAGYRESAATRLVTDGVPRLRVRG